MNSLTQFQVTCLPLSDGGGPSSAVDSYRQEDAGVESS